MAWLEVNPKKGEGNAALTISGSEHTGRLPRTGRVTVTNKNGTKPNAVVEVEETGKEEFTTNNNSTTSNVDSKIIPANQTSISVTGKSNTLSLQLSSRYVIGFSVKINGGEAVIVENSQEGDSLFVIPNDVGAKMEYDYEVIGTITKNTTAKIRHHKIMVNSSLSGRSESMFAQEAAVSTISVNKPAVTIPSAGTAQTVALESNDEWNIAIQEL